MSSIRCDSQVYHTEYCLSTPMLSATAALLKKQKFRSAIAVFNSSQQSGSLHFHYFTYQSLVMAAIKVWSSPLLLCLAAVPSLTLCNGKLFAHICYNGQQAGEPYTALEVFRQIQQAGLTPNFVTYSGLISALGKVRRRGQPSADLAYQLWQELYQLQEPLDAAAFRAGEPLASL